MKRLVSLLILSLLLVGVGVSHAQTEMRVLATTSILADVAQNVAGDLFTVDTLVPVGADTHAFEPSTADAARVAEASMLLTVGAGYEAFLGDLLENVGADSVQVVVVSNGLEILGFSEGHSHDEEHAHEESTDPMATPEATAEGEHSHEEEHAHEGEEKHIGVLGGDLECEAHEDHEHSKRVTVVMHGEDEHDHGACDPHVWTDPANVISWTKAIAAAFGAADPANEAVYSANADAYIAQLEALQTEVADLVATLPEEARVLVTNHEFLGYFAYAYGFEVVGTVLPGGTTDAEPNPQELAALIETIQAEGVRAIFAEVSANPQLAQVVAEEAGIDVVTTLYSESLSDASGPAATYLDYMRYNTQTIVDALSG